jgi:hypothetical protein
LDAWCQIFCDDGTFELGYHDIWTNSSSTDVNVHRYAVRDGSGWWWELKWRGGAYVEWCGNTYLSEV